MVQQKVAGIALAASLVLVGVGCGAEDKISEKASEKLAEEVTGGDVDIDAEDGSVKLTDEEGNTSEYGSGAKLPEGWPDDLAPPDSVTIVASSTQTQNGKKTLFVTGEADESLDDLYSGLKSQLEDAGYEITNESNLSSDSGGYAALEGTSDDFTASISLASDTTTDKTTILFNLTPTTA